MDEKEIKEHTERYAQLLTDYTALLGALDKVLKRITAARKEILYLEKTMEAVGVQIKDVDNNGDNISG
jgi:peptidoglycan hydrolase CwlO-like protein